MSPLKRLRIAGRLKSFFRSFTCRVHSERKKVSVYHPVAECARSRYSLMGQGRRIVASCKMELLRNVTTDFFAKFDRVFLRASSVRAEFVPVNLQGS